MTYKEFGDTTGGRIHTNMEGSVIDYTNNQFNKYKVAKLDLEAVDNLAQYVEELDLEWKDSTFGEDYEVDKKTRDCQLAWINDPNVTGYIFENMKSANQDPDWQFDITQMEEVQYTKYKTGGHYNMHNDSIMTTAHPRMVRKLSCTLVLNDEFEGGEFQFMSLASGIQTAQDLDLRKGDMLVFPSIQEHRVKPITSGERMVLVGWVWGPLFK